MKSDFYKFLSKEFPLNPRSLDRLIVSAFLKKNNIKNPKNKFISSYKIQSGDQDFDNLAKLLKLLGDFEIDLSLENLIQLFEYVISPRTKIVTGAVYTPKNIRTYIAAQCFVNMDNLDNVKICDPACGCGGFLYTAAKIIHDKTGRSFKKIFAENLFGLDTQQYAIDRTKILLTLFAITEGENTDFEFNLNRGNALNFKWSKHYSEFQGFDIVISNPPYVCSRNIDEESRQYIYDWEVSSTGHPDLYIPFFQIGIENLTENGILGFITMNTFFKSVNGRALRKYFQEKSYQFKILDFGSQQIFQSRSTYTCICLIKKTKSDSIKYVKKENANLAVANAFNDIKYSSLDSDKGWNLHNKDVLNQIESIGSPFGKLFKTRNGIATLKNKIYIFDPVREDGRYFYFQNGATYRIEKEACRDIINPNKLTKIDNIDELKKKVIFPYKYEHGNPFIVPEKEFEAKFPETYKYLKDKKEVLATRDKGKGDYDVWYAYGRNQSLEKFKNKLFFPHIAPNIPNFVPNTNENLLFHNGLAVITDNEKELYFLKKLMSSRLFWFYIENSSKPYGSGYYSLSRNYIKNFGVFEFSDDEKDWLIDTSNMDEVNAFIESKYEIELGS